MLHETHCCVFLQIRAEGITALRLHTEVPADARIDTSNPANEGCPTVSIINLQLPLEHHDEIIAQLDTWPLKGVVPFLTVVCVCGERER